MKDRKFNVIYNLRQEPYTNSNQLSKVPTSEYLNASDRSIQEYDLTMDMPFKKMEMTNSLYVPKIYTKIGGNELHKTVRKLNRKQCLLLDDAML